MVTTMTTRTGRDTMQQESRYIELASVAAELSVSRGSVYNYIKQLKLRTHKFPLDKHTYITRGDYQKIVMARAAAAEKKH